MTPQPYPLADILAQQVKGAFDDGMSYGERIGYLQRQRDAYVVGAFVGGLVVGFAAWALSAAGWLSISVNT